MKNVIVLALLTANISVGFAQQWKTNLNEALKEASVSGKNVLLFFSVADACDRCEKLESNVLKSEEFKEYASRNFVLVKQDFASGAAENLEENLLVVEKYNKDGFFPLVVIIGRNEKVLGQIGTYNFETPGQYIARLESIKKS